jgi:ABC-type sugar transport system substrate-binding protein
MEEKSMKKRTGKVICVVLAISLVLAAAACSKKDKPGAAPGKQVATNGYNLNIPAKDLSKMEIACVYMNVTTPFAQFLKKGIDEAAKEFGVNAYMTAPTEWSTENQVRLVEDLISKGVDGLAIAVIDRPALTPIIQKALQSGIPTICWNVDAPESGRLGFVGEDLYKAGQAVGQSLVDTMGQSGTVLITTEAIDAFFSQEREAGTRSVLSRYPNIRVMDTLNCPGDQQQMYSIIEAAMRANPQITGVASCGGTCFVLSKYLQDNNIGNMRSGKPIYNTGHDLREEKVIQIQDGWSTAQYGQNPYEQGYQSVKMFADFFKTAEPSSFVIIDTGILEVTEKNAGEILKRIADGEPIG